MPKRITSYGSSSDDDVKTPPPCDDPEIFDREESDAESVPLEEDEYEVEYIISHDYRVAERKHYYFVRWKGWSAEHDSWVAEEDMGCPNLVKAYKAKRRKKLKQEQYMEDIGIKEKKRRGKKKKEQQQQPQKINQEESDGEKEEASEKDRKRKKKREGGKEEKETVIKKEQEQGGGEGFMRAKRGDTTAGPSRVPEEVSAGRKESTQKPLNSLQQQLESEMTMKKRKGEKKKEQTEQKGSDEEEEEYTDGEGKRKRRGGKDEKEVTSEEESDGERRKKRKRARREEKEATMDEEEKQEQGGVEYSMCIEDEDEEQEQQQKRIHIDVKRGPMPRRTKRGTTAAGPSRASGPKEDGGSGSKVLKYADIWREYLGIDWVDIDNIEMEEEDDPQYEPMTPFNPDKPEEVDCWVKQLMDIEDNGFARGWEVESVLGVSAKAADGTRQCFVKFVGFKSPQQIPMAVVQEKAQQVLKKCGFFEDVYEPFIQWCSWQNGMDNLNKCGAYWVEKLRQPPSWMCRRSLAAFATWKDAKMMSCSNNENIEDDDIFDQKNEEQGQPPQSQQPSSWKWTPQSEGEEEYEEEEEDKEVEEEDDDSSSNDNENDDDDDVGCEDEQNEGVVVDHGQHAIDEGYDEEEEDHLEED